MLHLGNKKARKPTNMFKDMVNNFFFTLFKQKKTKLSLIRVFLPNSTKQKYLKKLDIFSSPKLLHIEPKVLILPKYM